MGYDLVDRKREELRRRKEIADRLRKGEEVVVTGNTGELKQAKDVRVSDGSTMKMDKDKLANSACWYKRNKNLFEEECEAMKKFFPKFELDMLDDDRLCWIGNLRPNGQSGGVWTIMAVYDNNHPHNNGYGGSVRVYSLKPKLENLVDALGQNLPHTLRDPDGQLCMCTARPEDVLNGAGVNSNVYTSAATHIMHAAKWIKLVEDWLEGIVDDTLFQENNY